MSVNLHGYLARAGKPLRDMSNTWVIPGTATYSHLRDLIRGKEFFSGKPTQNYVWTTMEKWTCRRMLQPVGKVPIGLKTDIKIHVDPSLALNSEAHNGSQKANCETRMTLSTGCLVLWQAFSGEFPDKTKLTFAYAVPIDCLLGRNTVFLVENSKRCEMPKSSDGANFKIATMHLGGRIAPTFLPSDKRPPGIGYPRKID